MNERIYKISIVAVIAIALTALTTLALAQQGPGSGMGKGPRGKRGPGYWDAQEGRGPGFWSELTEEQQAQIDELREKYRDSARDRFQDLRQKKLELRSELAKKSPEVEKARALQKEVSDLKSQMAQDRLNFILEAKKITPYADKFFQGRGHHFRGRGKGPMGRSGYGGYGNPDCPGFPGNQSQ